MFLPLNDGVALRRLRAPLVTWGLIIANGLIFLATNVSGVFNPDLVAVGYGAIPSVVVGIDFIDPAISHIPAWLTLVSTQFLHGDWFHLISNMLFLYIFGDNVEDALGHIRYLVFYLLSGIAGALAFVAMDWTGQAPLIGASGAISGVVAAYLMLYPRVYVFGLVFSVIPMRIRALYALGAWLALQVFSELFVAQSDIAYVAHIGGAVAGALLVGLLKSRHVSLLGDVTN